MLKTHQVPVRVPILRPLEVLSLRRYTVNFTGGRRQEAAYLDETCNLFFDIYGVWSESRDELSCDFVNEVLMGHVLPILHDPDDACLRTICSIYPSRYKGRVLYLRSVSSFLIDPMVRLLPFFNALHL